VIYFDSALVAKFYLDEPESDLVRARATAAGEVGCCALGRVEVVSVFHRKLRERVRTKAEFRALVDQFEADCAAAMWTWFPLTSAIHSLAIAKYRRLAETVFVRASDAIHLVCATDAGMTEIFSNDRHLLAAAPYFDIKPLSLTHP
jgi:predicted nucleic acid-binding protein